MKGQDFIISGPDILRKVKLLLWTVHIYNERIYYDFIMNGQDFFDGRSRF